MLEINI